MAKHIEELALLILRQLRQLGDDFVEAHDLLQFILTGALSKRIFAYDAGPFLKLTHCGTRCLHRKLRQNRAQQFVLWAHGPDTNLKTPKTTNKTGRKCNKLQNFPACLASARIAEAGEAYGRSKPYNVELLDAVNAYIEAHKQRIAISALIIENRGICKSIRWLPPTVASISEIRSRAPSGKPAIAKVLGERAY